MKSSVLIFLIAVLCLAGTAFAQESSPSSTPYPAPSIAPGTDPATATRAWLDTVPADKRAKSDAYFEGGYWLILWDFLVAAAIFILVLETGLSGKIRDIAEQVSKFKAVQVILYMLSFVIMFTVLSFPLAV